MFRRFKKRFVYENDNGQKITYPRNWAGEVTDDVATKADAEGATLLERKKSTAKAEGKPLSKMNKEELIAEAALRDITIDPTKTNAEIIAAIEAGAAN